VLHSTAGPKSVLQNGKIFSFSFSSLCSCFKSGQVLGVLFCFLSCRGQWLISRGSFQRCTASRGLKTIFDCCCHSSVCSTCGCCSNTATKVNYKHKTCHPFFVTNNNFQHISPNMSLTYHLFCTNIYCHG